jgi:hypothetical protein
MQPYKKNYGSILKVLAEKSKQERQQPSFVRLKPRLFKERLSDSENSLEQLSGIHLFERYHYDCLFFTFLLW